MKKIIYINLILFAFACGEDKQTETVDNHIDIIDAIPKTEEAELIENNEEVENINGNLKRLLKNPIDLAEYKEEYGPSNSGSENSKDLFYSPNKQGFYYRYMLFYNLRNKLKSHPNEGRLMQGLVFIVYKYGDKAGDFYDTNEELIAIESNLFNTTLGDLNFVEQEKNEILKFLGEAQYEMENQIIYEFNNNVFSLHFENDICNWFKFCRMNENIDLDKEIPFYLLDY